MTSLERFMESKEDGFFFIGHASALVRINKHLILFDPVWDHEPYGEYWEFRPEQINLESILSKVEFCIISHIHADHVCERIIHKLAAYDCRFFIMEGRTTLPGRLIHLGANVNQFPPYTWVKRLGLEFYFVPHAFNSIDSSCFVRSPNYCVYHGNDNFLSQEVIDKAKPDIGKVDVAMVPYAFVHWYPFLMNITPEEKQSEIARLNAQSLSQAQQFIVAFQPVQSIPMGNSLFHVVKDELNIHLSKPEDVVGGTPMEAGSWIIGQERHIEMSGPKPLSLDNLKQRVGRAETHVNHLIVVNGICIDLFVSQVWWADEIPDRPRTEFHVEPFEFKKWVKGKITFEELIGTRQFTCTRVPNVYNLEVFEWMNRWL